jgi:succinate dehydrogenase cytochrome b556 subunit
MMQETLPAPAAETTSVTEPAVNSSKEELEIAVRSMGGGMWAWLLQRITAGVLIFGLTSHLIATHVLAIGELSGANIEKRLATAFFVAVDVSLLTAGVFHALNGVRMVVLDYWLRSRSQVAALTAALWVLGLCLFLYGLWALWPWIG